jgi:DNA-binding PadR family transcriptional regulator
MSIKYGILGLLHYKDMHGYQIKNHMEENFAFMWTVNYGQIYASLKSLTDEGFIKLSEVVPSDNWTPDKKLYSLTQKGRDEFKKWMKTSPEKKVLFRDHFMMHFIFFGFIEAEEALKFIDEQIKTYEQDLASKREELYRWQDRGVYVSLARELGISYREAYLNWLHKARATITASSSKKPTPKKKRTSARSK